MKNTKPIYIIGHRNPDTDSICSAIGYAHLKQALGENVVAARAGKVNAETTSHPPTPVKPSKSLPDATKQSRQAV